MRVSRTCSACGYTADYATARLADAHHPRHSCEKQRRGLKQAARRAARLRARMPCECTHPNARHRHGTRATYVKDRCRCADCTAANTAASRTATRERIYGRWHPYVDADPVREHIAALRAAGIGVERIAALAGLSVSHIRQLAEQGCGDPPRTQRVRPSTAARVLGIGLDDASWAPNSRVDATGTRRRLQALIAIGWTAEQLADHLDRRPNSVHRSMTSRTVTARTAHEVASLYEGLWNTRPPRATGEQRSAADAAQAHAAAQGWPPPLAWDDIDTDPTPPAMTASPSRRNDMDEIAVARAVAGDNISYEDLSAVEKQEVVRRLTARGSSIRDIATLLGTTKRTVSCRRHPSARHDHRAADWPEVAEGGVPAAGVVEALEVGEDSVGQLVTGGPGVPVEQFGLAGWRRSSRPGRCRSSRRCCPSTRAGRPRVAGVRTPRTCTGWIQVVVATPRCEGVC